MLRQVQLLSDKSASCFLAKTFREATRVSIPWPIPAWRCWGPKAFAIAETSQQYQSRAKLRLDILAPDTTLHALVRAGYMLT